MGRRGVPGAALAAAGVTVAVLVAVSGRYGYHRDELYFLACGRHLAWGYPDQPPLVPLLARAAEAVAPGSLVVLRLPSALAAGVLVLTAALVSRELGDSRRAQTLAAASTALAGVVLAVGHLLSTATYAVTASAVLVWLAVRIARTGAQPLWLAAGAVTGLGLLANPFVALTGLALAGGVAAVGPRALLRSPWPAAGAAVAAVLVTPYLVWQARHGWPQVTVARHIAAGGSATSEPRWLVLPFQLLLIGPVLSPLGVAGLLRLARDEAVRWSRFAAAGYVLALAAVIVAGGKPYYVAGFFPLLLAAGAQPALDWIRSGAGAGRRRLLVAAFALSLPGLLVTLPLLPAGLLHRTPVVALNDDAGETLGWPAYVDEIAAVTRRVRATGAGEVVVLASNYGEAGAIDRYGGPRGLPRAYSGHNAYAEWGPPPGDGSTVVAVGFDRQMLAARFAAVRLAARLDDHLHVDTAEQGAPVWVCRSLRGSWRQAWPHLRRLG